MIKLFLLFSSNARAHKPSFGPHPSIADSFQVSDPNISIVVYQDITCEDDQLWLEFSAEEGFGLYVQAGIPVIERLESYLPHVAIVFPGFPTADREYPFEIPEGMGVYELKPTESPSDFYEPFTQTSSWIWVEETISLPQTGSGYIVGWNENTETGKLWLATGTVEDFSDVAVSDFIMWTEYVNNFHETGRYEQILPKEEQTCTENIESSEEKQGCGGTMAWLLLPILFNRRRKENVT